MTVPKLPLPSTPSSTKSSKYRDLNDLVPLGILMPEKTRELEALSVELTLPRLEDEEEEENRADAHGRLFALLAAAFVASEEDDARAESGGEV